MQDMFVLLLQARSAEKMERKEIECFVERTRLPRSQIHAINVARGDDPNFELLTQADTLLIGGAGEYSATNSYSWTRSINGLVRRAVFRRVPTFGACWGHQVIARALGGRVVHDPDRTELGLGSVFLTERGKQDPLFSRLPQPFRVNMGHHDRVVELPPDAIEIASNSQPNQAFKIRGKPVYGTQFHSELDAVRLKERVLTYEKYNRDELPSSEFLQTKLGNVRNTSDTDCLLRDFLTVYAGGN